MSDDAKKPEKKDEHKDEHKDAKPAEAKAAKSGGLVPIIAAVVVLVGIGVGGAMFVLKSFVPAPVEKPGADKTAASGEHGAGDGHGEPAAGQADGPGSGLLAKGKELDPINLKGNVTGSGGTRYVTMEVGLWVPIKDHAALNEPSVRRLIQARLEETVKTYQLEDLGSPNIQPRMRKDFATAIERLLRTVQSGRSPEDKFILETTVTSLLTQ